MKQKVFNVTFDRPVRVGAGSYTHFDAEHEQKDARDPKDIWIEDGFVYIRKLNNGDYGSSPTSNVISVNGFKGEFIPKELREQMEKKIEPTASQPDIKGKGRKGTDTTTAN